VKGFLIILGHARSGTTLLRALLNVHRKIFMVNEPHLIRSLRGAGLSYEGAHPATMRKAVVDSLFPNHRERLAAAVMDGFVESSEPFTFLQAYEELLPLDSKVDCVYGEKSPENLRYLRGILSLFPDACYVHIIRDPRSIVLSKYRKKFHAAAKVTPGFSWRTISYVASIAMHWRAVVSHGCACLGNLEANIEIRYEDLLVDPSVALKTICDGIGVEFDPDMLNPQERKDEQAFKESRGQVHALLTEPLQPERAEGWRDLPSWAVWMVEIMCGEIMQKKQYSLAGFEPPIWQRLLCRLFLFTQLGRLRHVWWRSLGPMGVDSELKEYL